MHSSRLTPFLSPPGGWSSLVSLLHNVVQALLQRLGGLLRGGVARHNVVELLGQLERHIPVVLVNRTRLGVVKDNLLSQLDDRARLYQVRVIVERLPGRPQAAIESEELLLLSGCHKLGERHGLLHQVGGGVDKLVPPAEGAVALHAWLRHRYRCDPDLFGFYIRVSPIFGGEAQQAIESRPVSQEYRVTLAKDRLGGRLVVVAHGLGRYAVGDQAGIRLEARHRLGAVYDDLAARYFREDLAAVGPDVLAAVADPTLVVHSLEDKAVLCARVLRGFEGHLFEFVPGLRGTGEARLLEEVLAVVDHPCVREPRYPIDRVLICHGTYGGGQELLLLRCGEVVGEVLDVALRGELDRPDDVASYDVYVAASCLKLGR